MSSDAASDASSRKNEYQGPVTVSHTKITGRKAERAVIYIPAKLGVPAGNFYMHLSNGKEASHRGDAASDAASHDLQFIEFLMDFFQENKTLLQPRITPDQREMFKKVVGRLSNG